MLDLPVVTCKSTRLGRSGSRRVAINNTEMLGSIGTNQAELLDTSDL